MRFFPHDDNQGGFFVAVFQKLEEQKSGIIEDNGMTMNAWENSNVRQKTVLDELDEFSKWFEDLQQKHYKDKNIPKEEQEELGLSKMVADAKEKEQQM